MRPRSCDLGKRVRTGHYSRDSRWGRGCCAEIPDRHRHKRQTSSGNRQPDIDGRACFDRRPATLGERFSASPELWHYVSDNAASYRALVFAPYMFWTTFAVGQIVGDRSIIMPCLHDELPARLELFQPMISGARGLWFLSEPEVGTGGKHLLAAQTATQLLVLESISLLVMTSRGSGGATKSKAATFTTRPSGMGQRLARSRGGLRSRTALAAARN